MSSSKFKRGILLFSVYLLLSCYVVTSTLAGISPSENSSTIPPKKNTKARTHEIAQAAKLLKESKNTSGKVVSIRKTVERARAASLGATDDLTDVPALSLRDQLKSLEGEVRQREKAFETLRNENLRIFFAALAESSVIGFVGLALTFLASEYKELQLSQASFMIGTFTALGHLIWTIRHPERAFYAAQRELNDFRRKEWEVRKEALKPLFPEADLEFSGGLVSRALEKVGQLRPSSDKSLESRFTKVLPKLKRFDEWVAFGGYSYFDKKKGRRIEKSFDQVVSLINETLLDAALFVETKGENVRALRDMEASDLPALSRSLDEFFAISAQSLGSSSEDEIGRLLEARPKSNLYDLARKLKMSLEDPEFKQRVFEYLQTLPKVSLHEHTSGLIYPDHLLSYFLEYPEARRRFALVYLALNPKAYPKIKRGASASARSALDLQANPVNPRDITLQDADLIFGEQVGFPVQSSEQDVKRAVARLKRFTTYSDNKLKFQDRLESWNRFESAFAYIKCVTDVKPKLRYKLIRKGIWRQYRDHQLQHLEITDYHSESFDKLAKAIIKVEDDIRKDGGQIDIALLKAFRKDQFETLSTNPGERTRIATAYKKWPTLEQAKQHILERVLVSDHQNFGLMPQAIHKEFNEAYAEIARQQEKEEKVMDLRERLILSYEARKLAHQEFRDFEKELDRIETFHPEYRKRIVGISSIGDEVSYVNWIGSPILRRAKQIGLKVTSHVGERWLPGEYLPALERVKREMEIGVNRLAHGTVLGLNFDKLKDPTLSRSDRETAKKLQSEILNIVHHRMIHIELNPTSQIMFSPVYSEYKDHAAIPFLKKGLSVSINSDDSSVFNTSISQELLAIWFAKASFRYEQIVSTLDEASVNRFYESTNEVIERLIQERALVVEAQEKLQPPAAVVFGSARIPATDPAYMMAFMMGQWMWKMGIVPRTGMGPSIMSFVLEGYLAARNQAVSIKSGNEKNAVIPDSIKTQGVRILLNFFEPASSFVEIGYSFSHFVFRKLSLYSTSRGVIAFPGGFGTIDELFETWRLELPLVLVNSSFWAPIMKALYESWDQAGLLDQIRTRPYMTDFQDYTAPPEAFSHLLESHQESYTNKEDKTRLAGHNQELREGLTKLSKLKLSVAVLGKPTAKSPELPVLREITEKLLAAKIPVRALSRGVALSEILQGAKDQDREDLVQAVLFKAEKDNGWTKDEIGLSHRFPDHTVLTSDDPNQRLMGFFGVRGAIVLPGGVGTMNRLFDLVVVMQTGKVRRRPIILVGKKFWSPILKAIEEAMLKYDTPLISLGDMHMMQIVDTADEAMEKLGLVTEGASLGQIDTKSWFESLKRELRRGDAGEWLVLSRPSQPAGYMLSSPEIVAGSNDRRRVVELKDNDELAFRTEILSGHSKRIQRSVNFILHPSGRFKLFIRYEPFIHDAYESATGPRAIGIDSKGQLYAVVPSDFHLFPTTTESRSLRNSNRLATRLGNLPRDLYHPISFVFEDDKDQLKALKLRIITGDVKKQLLSATPRLSPLTSEEKMIKTRLEAMRQLEPEIFDPFIAQLRSGKKINGSDEFLMRLALYGFVDRSGTVRPSVINAVKNMSGRSLGEEESRLDALRFSDEDMEKIVRLIDSLADNLSDESLAELEKEVNQIWGSPKAKAERKEVFVKVKDELLKIRGLIGETKSYLFTGQDEAQKKEALSKALNILEPIQFPNQILPSHLRPLTDEKKYIAELLKAKLQKLSVSAKSLGTQSPARSEDPDKAREMVGKILQNIKPDKDSKEVFYGLVPASQLAFIDRKELEMILANPLNHIVILWDIEAHNSSARMRAISEAHLDSFIGMKNFRHAPYRHFSGFLRESTLENSVDDAIKALGRENVPLNRIALLKPETTSLKAGVHSLVTNSRHPLILLHYLTQIQGDLRQDLLRIFTKSNAGDFVADVPKFLEEIFAQSLGAEATAKAA